MKSNILDYLEETVEKYSPKIGFIDETEEISFGEFQNRAKMVAMTIPKGMASRPIIVFLEKGVKELIAFIGIVYSGNYYVPIDPEQPPERIANILDITESEVILTDMTCLDKIKTCVSDSMKIILYENYTETDVDEAYLSEIRNKQIDIDPLYVLFTSGSTGMPKGVMISHRSVIDYVEWLIETFHFSNKTIFGNQAPFYFDNSILDIYSTLKVGATMCIIPDKLFIFPNKLLNYLEEKRINTIFWVPSALITVANSNALSQHNLPDIENILFCGEVMPNKQLNTWRHFLPNVLYANLYGPTEITDVCSYYIIDRTFQDEEPLPIGKACKNTQILVLNDDNNLCNIEEVGELCVRGTCLSLGYYGNLEKTEHAFVQNPLNSKWRDCIYRTGDLVKYNERGELIYLCRKDFQIKHMGHRIELGEIETAAYALDQMKECCALYNEQKKQIVLFCVLSELNIREKDIYLWLKSKLPKYMLPTVIVIKDSLQLNSNGKIDRIILKKEMVEIDDKG